MLGAIRSVMFGPSGLLRRSARNDKFRGSLPAKRIDFSGQKYLGTFFRRSALRDEDLFKAFPGRADRSSLLERPDGP